MDKRRLALISDAVLPFHNGGKETRHFEVARRLASDGFQVDVYTMRWWDGRGDYHHAGMRYRSLGRCWPLYRGERRSIVQAALFAVSALRLVFKRFDVVEVDSVPVIQVFVLRLVCWLRRRQLVVTWHEVWGKDNWRQYLGRLGVVAALLERWALHLPDHVVSPSEGTAARIREIVGSSCQVTVVPNGIDTAAIAAASPSRLQCDVVYVGRLIGHKNVDALLRGLHRMRATGWSGTCRIIGTGIDEAALRRLSLALDLDACVRFDGRLAKADEVVAAMKSAKVFVSLSEREGFGIAVLEAMACGLPVVVYDHPDNQARALVAERINGTAVHTLDPDQIAAAVLWALQHRSGLASAATAVARDHDWDAIARQMGKVYAP